MTTHSLPDGRSLSLPNHPGPQPSKARAFADQEGRPMITGATTYARDALQIAADTAIERTALANPPYNVCAHVYPEMGDRAYQITYCRGDDSELVASGPTPGAALVDFARELTGETLAVRQVSRA